MLWAIGGEIMVSYLVKESTEEEEMNLSLEEWEELSHAKRSERISGWRDYTGRREYKRVCVRSQCVEESDWKDLLRELNAWCNTSHNLQLPCAIPTPTMSVWESLDKSEHAMVD